MNTQTYEKCGLEDLLLVLRRNIIESLRKEKIKHDLTLSQVEVLRLIGSSGKETMKSIASYLKITPPSATELVKEMEKKGLVERKNDKKDRRITFIVLTKKAKQHFTAICKRKNIFFKKMISGLNKAEQESLENIIRVLIANN